MTTVYLAGPITGLTYDEAIDWRGGVEKVLRDYGVHPLSPLRGKDYLRPLGVLDDAGDMEKSAYAMNEDWPLSTPKGITVRDRNDVRTCDAVLVNLLGAERVSVGTVIEIAWADAYRVPSVIAMEKDNPHRHAMINEVAGLIVPDLDMAVRCVLTIVGVTPE
jgi:nucleoside 2-deoxyribosyltransferase